MKLMSLDVWRNETSERSIATSTIAGIQIVAATVQVVMSTEGGEAGVAVPIALGVEARILIILDVDATKRGTRRSTDGNGSTEAVAAIEIRRRGRSIPIQASTVTTDVAMNTRTMNIKGETAARANARETVRASEKRGNHAIAMMVGTIIVDTTDEIL